MSLIPRQRPLFFVVLILFALIFSLRLSFSMNLFSSNASLSSLNLLTDPFLQLPTNNSVRVVWFTEFAGVEHQVSYGDNLEFSVTANTQKLKRTSEDKNSKVSAGYEQLTPRSIWRHEAEVTGLTQGKKTFYKVISQVNHQGKIETISSDIFSLMPNPPVNKSLKILLTSDHQLMPMVAANLQKVVETVGQVDGVFLAGDLVNIPDRASEWFDDNRGGAFFPCLQGNANYQLEKEGISTLYHGGEIIQNAPLFTAIGNHEVMGRYSATLPLNEQFKNAFPRQVAQKYYADNQSEIAINTTKEEWIKNYSFNTDTYEEIFTLPQSDVGGQKYYAVTLGNIRLVVLYVTHIWRSPSPNTDVKGRYQEAERDFDNPQNWGYGQHIFEPIAKDSQQYQWLEQELQSKAFQQAKYKIVMLHNPPHTLGGNIVPPFTDPVQKIDYNLDGNIQSIRYDYPIEKDYIIQDLVPLLEKYGVQLVFYGHSHLWNRFQSAKGIHFLESSNVGNSYGAHLGENKRPVPQDNPSMTYAETGNPNGLKPIVPTLNPLVDEKGQPLPYIASNDLTVFSILETDQGTISSYYFDTRNPNSDVIKFDEFILDH